MRDALAERHGRRFRIKCSPQTHGGPAHVDASTPVKFPKCFWLSRKGNRVIRQLIMDRGMLWNFDRARTIDRQARLSRSRGKAVFESGPKASFLFDLDGTLVDSVYQHVLAWREGTPES